MEKPFLAVFCIGFGLLDAVRGFPVEFSSVETGEPNSLWLTSYFITAIGFLLTVIVVILGCVCCRNGKGFKHKDVKVIQEFSNSSGSLPNLRTEGFVNPTSNAELTIFPPAGANSNQICRFEPLPDIKPQVPNLRPAAFSYSEREISSQDWFSEPYSNFPRNQLKYVVEYGRGWFGRVVEGEAQNIVPKEKLTKVMVKILHEDATTTDQMYFLNEVKFYKDLKHPNILRLLGRCLETEPFLVILECYPNGDLKTFLSQNLASARALVEQGATLQMCSNITAGLQYMHKNKFIHTDLAARNCLVGPDLTIKIGDYGNSIENFKSDYYCAGSVALPIRWCAPETLKCTDVTIETREVTPPANIWSLAIVFWEICEFCKLPYAELNDDQVIVRVLGEKNYFLDKPSMFCLHKDEMYHLMKLCWGPPEQRPTAAQLQIIFSNLISSGKVHGKETQTDSKRLSQDFEQRWQNLKPNYIPKKDNTTEGDHGPGCLSISSKIKNAKVVDSSLVDSPLGLFMTNKISGQGSPRFCLKSDEEKSNKIEGNEEGEKNNFKIQDRCNVEEIRSNVSLLRKSDENEMKPKFELNTETRLPEILNPNQKFKNHEADVDSWLKGVEINNEEDESFVRKISEAIRDLDAALAMEKTSSSEEESGKSSHQNSPGKDLKENNETVVDFKLGSDISSFMNFTPKSFELTSLQNSEQPQSLNFTDPFINGSTEKFNDISTQGNLISAMIENPENKFEMKNYAFDESLKENDSLVGGQSRNSSDTDDEIWRKRIEKGEISEKVKEKSKSIANLMILTHIDASDESDNDLEKPFEKNLSRNSFSRRSGSFARSSISSNIFGSENDIMNAILEDDFKESLKKLSNDHKEYGRFDSLGMIMPTYAGRENVWENLFKNSVPGTESPFDLAPQISTPTDAHKNAEDSKLESDRVSNIFHPEEKPEQSAENSNNFLGKVASEKLIDNKSIHENAENKKSICTKKLEDSNCFSEQEDNLVQMNAKCDNTSDSDSSCSSKRNSSHPHKENSKNVGRVVPSLEEKTIGSTDFYSIPDETTANSENSYNNLLFKRKVGDESEPQTDVENVRPTAEASQVQYFTENKTPNLENIAFSKIPEITVSEAKQESEVAEEVVELPAAKIRPFKFVLKGEELIPEILITKEPEENASELEEKLEFNFENTKVKPFKFVLKEDEISLASEKPKTNETGAKNTVEEIKLNHKDLHESVSKQDCTNDNGSVIIGACEDCTLDFFKGLTTTSEDVSLEKKITEENEKRDAIFGCFSDTKNENVDWDNHLGETLTFQQNRQNFDGFDFESFECNNPKAETKESPKNLVDSPDCKNLNFSELCPVEIIVNFIESEKEHSDKVDEFFHINRITSFSGMSNEEEYDNFKLRTPDDERSSDSGFRDKGSLSESVEDACEGKYNLEDIEAELEEAYVKGAFGNCEVDKENDSGKESKNCNNFEYEESKFYEDENKNDDDFSDIDGEIEFWQNKDGSDYYPKISEFSPTCSQGWYLHPPDENLVTYNRTMNEDIANAIRNELRENLPVQTRSFSEFNEDFYEPALEDPKRDLNIHYASDISIPLSPIIEEHDATVSEAAKKNIKNSLFEGNSSSKVRKNVVNLMESVKSIDTNTFMQYLDYMVENEGRDLDDLEDIEEESCSKEKEKNTVNAIDNSSDILKTLKNKPDKENLTNVLTTASCDSNSEIKSHDIVCSVQPNNFESDFTVIHNYDALMPDNVAFEGEEKKNSELKAEASFLDDERRKGDILEINTNDNFGETEDQIFSPEISSPDRERSLSDISRSSNDTRTGDALSEITLSSPDLVPDCFATSGQDGIQISEENEIENDFKGDGIGIRIDTLEESIGPDSKTQNELFLLNERNYCTDDMSKKFKIPEEKISAAKLSPIKVCNEPEENDLYEMSTSFMGENCDDVDDDYDEEDGGIDSQVHLHGNIINKEKKEEIKNQIGDENPKSEVNVDDTYTADWDSDSSAAEEMSSSSGEFIWKDGDRVSKLKAVQASDRDVENPVDQDSQIDRDAEGNCFPSEENIKKRDDLEKSENDIENDGDGGDDDDNDSSTGSSASITDFVPSAWNSQATPSRSALRSTSKNAEQQEHHQQPKKTVWFKKQKYHCVYEYPREPSDSEDVESYNQFSYDKNLPENSNKHFIFGVNTLELPNKHFPYGISNVIDYSSCNDWDVLDEDEGDLSLTDTDSDNVPGKSAGNGSKEAEFNFYNLSSFDYDFNNAGSLSNGSEFFVSSSSRPFQPGSTSQVFPEANQTKTLECMENLKDSKSEKSELMESDVSDSADFTTPDSGLDDSENVSPLDKKPVLSPQEILLEMENLTESKEGVKEGVLNILDNLKFNFSPEIVETNLKNLESVGFAESKRTENGPSSPLSPSGLGELRHTRGRLKLDLPFNHNAELGAMITKKINRIH